MTMFSAEKLHQFYGGYGGVPFSPRNYDVYCDISNKSCIGSDKIISGMAEDESRNESLNKGTESTREENDQGWLQLSLGVGVSREIKPDLHRNSRKDGSGLIELELLPSSNNNSIHNTTSNLVLQNSTANLIPEIQPVPMPVMSPSFFLSGSSSFSQNQEINLGFRPYVPFNNIATASSSFFPPSTSMEMPGSYFSRRPFQFYAGVDVVAPQVPRPSIDFRVIAPPRRPHSGVWFMLQASKHQETEPFLPQISKSYLRIKDGKMTIRLVMKYLVNKLKLENESEIEIKCRGQRLVPFLTLEHVRDNIWSTSRDSYITLLPNSSTTDHIMVLNYGRTLSS